MDIRSWLSGGNEAVKKQAAKASNSAKAKSKAEHVKAAPSTPKKRKAKIETIDTLESDEEGIRSAAVKKSPKRSKAAPNGTAKKPRIILSDDDESDEDIKFGEENNDEQHKGPPAKSKASKYVDKPSANKVKIEERKEEIKKDEERKSAPKRTVATANVVEEDKPKDTETNPSTTAGNDSVHVTPEKKNKFWALKNREPPQALGSREIPEGKPNCFSGMTFVFTGELESITREDAQDTVKRYGGKVTTAVSSRTSYLVVGRDPGESKTKKANEMKTKVIDEDGFFSLLETSEEKAEAIDTKAKTATQKQMEKMDKEAVGSIQSPTAGMKEGDTQTLLWTDKWKPTKYSEICGNAGLIKKIATWLREWPNYAKEGFKKSGPDEMGIYRAVLLSGPPGIGKTTAAHLCARLEGYEILEFNASDARGKKIIEMSIGEALENRSVTEFFNKNDPNTLGKGKDAAPVLPKGKKAVLIMDEVDGMSAGDRGGGAALASLLRKTKIPVICICNDRQSQKVQAIARHCFDARFRRPQSNMIRSRIMTIATREGLQIGGSTVDALVESTQADIRQIINVLSTFRLSHKSMNYDEGKALGKVNEKHSQLNIFQICEQLLSAKYWRSLTLNEKSELYFHEYQLANLMIQENYAKYTPVRAKNADTDPAMEAMNTMQLLSNAADAISEGDLVDRQIHGSEQKWSLMPVHSIFSCVRPAYYMHGYTSGSEGRFGFPLWLGQNSKTSKNYRLLRDVQMHMRLKISGTQSEVRQSYLPALTPSIGQPIVKSNFDEAINILDDYYLSREDVDTIFDLELGIKGKQPFAKRLTGPVKTAFTRSYNSTEHPTPYSKTSVAPPKKLGGGGALPDAEEAFVDDEAIADAAESDSEEAIDESVDKDKMIKEKKTNKRSNGSSKAEGSRKKLKT